MSVEEAALVYAREAVAQFEEKFGHDQLAPARVREGLHDSWERVQCAKVVASTLLTTLSDIEAFGYAHSGYGFSCARMASKALGRLPR